jgi:protein-tyrosine phosphatase
LLDLHSHVLPGVDDGAPDLEQALAMCRLARDDGVRLMAATPHWYPGRDPLPAGEIARAVAGLRAELAARGVDLELVAGAEVALDPELPRLARAGLLPTLNGGPYLLLECPRHTSPRLLPDLVYDLRLAGLRPILAHAERTWVGTNRWDWLEGLVEQGCLVQVTAASLTGELGSGPRKTAEALLPATPTRPHGVRRDWAGRRPWPSAWPVPGPPRCSPA